MEIFLASDLLSLESSEIEDYVIDHGILPKQGKMFIYGPAGWGKSILCQQLAFNLSCGSAWLDQFKTKPSTVVYIDSEMPLYPVRDRLKDMVPAYPSANLDSIYVIVVTGDPIKLDSRYGQASFDRIFSHLKPDVVIIDPFYKFISGDENSARDVQIALDAIDRSLYKYMCSAIIIDHPRKGRYSSEGTRIDAGQEEMRATKRKSDWADTVISIKPQSPLVKLSFEKLRYAKEVIKGFNIELVRKPLHIAVQLTQYNEPYLRGSILTDTNNIELSNKNKPEQLALIDPGSSITGGVGGTRREGGEIALEAVILAIIKKSKIRKQELVDIMQDQYEKEAIDSALAKLVHKKLVVYGDYYTIG